jgi:bifunctional DNA-binding transcriptional regulator/antitoxin component of YhaV-PrlF toxin-antitoxin module
MSDTLTVRLAQRGVLTLPKELRESYGLKPGDDLTLLDLGGAFLLTPIRTEIDALADRVRDQLLAEGETLESMLATLREERETYDIEG